MAREVAVLTKEQTVQALAAGMFTIMLQGNVTQLHAKLGGMCSPDAPNSAVEGPILAEAFALLGRCLPGTEGASDVYDRIGAEEFLSQMIPPESEHCFKMQIDTDGLGHVAVPTDVEQMVVKQVAAGMLPPEVAELILRGEAAKEESNVEVELANMMRQVLAENIPDDISELDSGPGYL